MWDVEEGYRLFWECLDANILILPSSSTTEPFLREKDARNYGKRKFKEIAKRR